MWDLTRLTDKHPHAPPLARMGTVRAGFRGGYTVPVSKDSARMLLGDPARRLMRVPNNGTFRLPYGSARRYNIPAAQHLHAVRSLTRRRAFSGLIFRIPRRGDADLLAASPPAAA